MTTPFRITPASSTDLHEIERTAGPELRRHFDLIKRGLEAIPGVPGEAIYGAVTLRTLALKPELFTTWFLTEYHSVKQGELDRGVKEVLATVIARTVEGTETPTCAPYHAGAARFEGAADNWIAAAEDWPGARATVPDRVRDLVDLGLKAAIAPREVTDDDVQRVRRHGVSDAALVELVSAALIAYNLAALNQTFDLIEGQG